MKGKTWLNIMMALSIAAILFIGGCLTTGPDENIIINENTEIFYEYTAVGGIAGTTEHVKIDNNGETTYTQIFRSRTNNFETENISREELEQNAQLMLDAGIMDMEKTIYEHLSVSDGFRETLHIKIGSKEKTFTGYELSQSAPKKLKSLIEWVNYIGKRQRETPPMALPQRVE